MTKPRPLGTYPKNCFDPREERCWLVRYTPMPKREVKPYKFDRRRVSPKVFLAQ